MSESKGVLDLLFDFQFTDFITKRLIKLVYAVGVVLAGLVSVTALFSGFSQGAGVGLLGLVLCPLFFVIGVALLRMQLELVMVIFRIADNTTALAEARSGAADAADRPGEPT